MSSHTITHVLTYLLFLTLHSLSTLSLTLYSLLLSKGGREVDDMVAWMAAVARGKDPIEEEKKARPGLYKVHAVFLDFFC